MSDRIEAAEAILATVAVARARMSALATAHLPWEAQLNLELKASVGASAARAELESTLDLVDRRLSLWRGARGALAASTPAPVAPAPAVTRPRPSLPVSIAPPRPQLEEDTGDEATPMSGPIPALSPIPVPIEPEHEVTASQVEPTLSAEPPVQEPEPSVQEPEAATAEPPAELVELGPQDQISSTDPDEQLFDPEDDDIEAVLLEEAAAAAEEFEDEPAVAEEVEDEEPPVHEELPPHEEPTAHEEPAAQEAAPSSDEPEEEPPPPSWDHLVRFVEPAPAPRRSPELVVEEPAEEEPVAEEATIQDHPLDVDSEDDLEGDLLEEAVDAALEDEPSVSTTLDPIHVGETGLLFDDEEEEEDEDAAVNTLPLQPLSSPRPALEMITIEDAGAEEPDPSAEDGGTEEPDQEEPPVLVATPRHVSAAEIDEERTLHGVPVLAELDEEPAPPPRREPPRATPPVQIQPVSRGRDQALEVESTEAEESVDDEGSPPPASGSGFSVTLERPRREEDEEDSVYDLGAMDQSAAPRLTDEDEGYAVGVVEDSAPRSEIDPALAAEFLRKAREAEARGDLTRAIVHYQDLLDLTPESVDAYLGRGRCFMEMGDYAAAMSDFQRAEDLDQKSPEPLVEMGNLFFARKEYRRAIEFYDQAIDIDPTHAMARCRRGICHHYRKNHKQAFQDLQRAYSLNPEIPNIRKYVQMAVKAMEKSR